MLQKPTYPRIQPAYFDAHVVLDVPFDEGAGDRVLDYSGHNNHGTLVNMEEADWVSGLGGRGRALVFDGVDEYIDFGDLDSLDFVTGDSFTIVMWIKPAAAGTLGYLLCKFTLATGWAVYFKGDTDQVLFYHDAAAVIASNAVFVDVARVCIAVVYNAGTVTFYRNGVAAGGGAGAVITANVHNVLFGTRPGGAGAGHFYDGDAGEHMGVITRALSTSEVLRLYEQSRSRYRIG